MPTSPNGSASAPKSDVMSGLEVRSPAPAAKSSPDLADKGLAAARAGQPRPRPIGGDTAPGGGSKANPNVLLEIEARKPPGPHAKPAPAPLKGPSAATPPRGPSAEAAAAAAAQKSAPKPGSKPAPQAAPVAAPPPAAAAAAAGPPKASSLIDLDAPWLPDEPDRKDAFLQVFRYWHAQVRPEYAHKARPAFLFLVTALPVMVKARDQLKALNLWEPPGEHSRQARDQHTAWKKYCEFLPRAQQALQELDDYRHLSLLTALDDLNSRITKAEKRFREGLAVRPGR